MNMIKIVPFFTGDHTLAITAVRDNNVAWMRDRGAPLYLRADFRDLCIMSALLNQSRAAYKTPAARLAYNWPDDVA